VDLDSYRAFTRKLTAGLERRAEVLGLIAVGSMAEQDYAPDEWSDHDFYVIVQPGVQERYRDRTDWLPNSEEIVWAFRETEHGVKVLYGSGHLLEYAVFDEEELDLAKTNRYRVLIDRGGIEERMAQIAQETRAWAEASSDLFHAGQFLTNLLVGMGRYRRGEGASAHQFVKARASQHLVRLLARHVPSERHGLVDNIDPTRRFEVVYPALGEELREAMLCETPEAAGRMLAMFSRELPAARIGVPEDVLALVAEQVAPGEGSDR
jgi:lincosamide nucleotidyltransferase